MEPVQRYAISMPGPVGGHRPATVVVVHWTPKTVGGSAVYTDDAGDFKVSIDAGGVASLLNADEGHQHQCLHAVPLQRARSSAAPPYREAWGGPVS
ncbi:DUF6296 family protein [Kitasatospora sp. NBC_01287]|uniref:DUF6296 family protein n=1 Tax=Kitasatospora sp. NBC_01287 TaxID=2903573 RepID=UPI00224F6F88|nr:DUF6296 family protein [Kitasatospora sp. NBC_01287]MCX4744531.1 DUF6296 family protein [Kitasatospora sp. NBC_01287]